VTEKLVELGFPEWLAFAFKLGPHGVQPHLAISRILESCCVAMVGRIVADQFKGFAQR
jgi:hypothetical protein